MRCTSIVVVLLLSVGSSALSCQSGGSLALQQAADGLAMSNGYVCLVFTKSPAQLSVLSGDYSGQGNYGYNSLAAGGFVLEREDRDGTVHSSAGSTSTLKITVLSQTSSLISVAISNLLDDTRSPSANETWTLSLQSATRYFTLTAAGQMVRTTSAKAVRHALYLKPTSIYGFYERGVVQMKDAPPGEDFYGSKDTLFRFYAVGGSGGGTWEQSGNCSVDVTRDSWTATPATVLLNSNSGNPYWSGFQELLVGDYANFDSWGGGWQGLPVHDLEAGTNWHTIWRMAPNNYDFPVLDLDTSANLPREDMQGFLEGIYPGIVGCLNNHDNEVRDGYRVGQIAPSIHAPRAAYYNTYNYFDPDNFVGLTAMVYSGNPYLQAQALDVLLRSGQYLSKDGQLPHHFVGVTPTYIALSGETQTGPNLFWILTCLNYAKATGDMDWLRSYIPTLRFATNFIWGLFDKSYNMVNVPGSLMIDVFIRNQFTSDSNAMIVGFFNEFALAEEAVGNSTGAAILRSVAQNVSDAVNKYLWAASDDHYITQRDRNGNIRDFVDYDSNLIALAHGIAPPERAAKVFGRVDRGNCTHGWPGRRSATWVSEIYYGPSDCTNGNTGDSKTAMARIGWFDAHARRRYGDLATFNNMILNPIRDDLIGSTWLRERYNCDGTQALWRTQYYFEYPAMVTMLLREIRYGINLGYNSLSISPFGVTTYNYHIGNVNVDYSNRKVVVSVPGSGNKAYTIDGLAASTTFTVTGSGSCSSTRGSYTSSSGGSLTFSAPVGTSCTLTIAA